MNSRGGEGGGVLATCAEDDALAADGEEAVVGEADAVGVPPEVAEDGLGPGEGRLRIGDPFGAVQPAPEAPPGEVALGGGLEARDVIELQLTVAVRHVEGGYQLPRKRAERTHTGKR